MLDFEKTFKILRKNIKRKPILEDKIRTRDPYKILIATILSARTRDETAALAARRLFKEASDIQKLSRLKIDKIQKLIYPVNFYKNKSINLKKLADYIVNYHFSQIPAKFEDLIKLPGVGRKTANLVLARAFKIPAIAVDTHVHKIANLMGWVKTLTPNQTEKELARLLPKKYWIETNSLLVALGQKYKSTKKLEEFLKRNKLTLL